VQPLVEEAQQALVSLLDEHVCLVPGVGQPAKQRLAQDQVAEAVESHDQAAAGTRETPHGWPV
jgi:hypothetical protein